MNISYYEFQLFQLILKIIIIQFQLFDDKQSLIIIFKFMIF